MNPRTFDPSAIAGLLVEFHHFLSPAILIFMSSVLTLILKQPVQLLPLLSTLNLTTVTLSVTIFLSPSSRFRTVLHVLWLKLLYLLISYPSSDLCTGSR